MNEQTQGNFIEKACETASRAIGFAVERNIPAVLRDINRQIALRSADDEDSAAIDVTVKFSCSHPEKMVASIRIKSVSWACKAQHADTDFQRVNIDIMQPDLPGLDNGQEKEFDPWEDGEYTTPTIPIESEKNAEENNHE